MISTRCGAALCATLVSTAVALTCVLAQAPAGAAAKRKAKAPVHIHLAKGVALWHSSFKPTPKRTVRVSLMQVDLSVRGVRIDAGSPAGMIGHERQALSTMANANHAVGAINADFFDLHHSDSTPAGGLIRSGHVLKTPRPTRQANFYIRQNGTAKIGPLVYSGSVTRTATAQRPAITRTFASTNTVYDAYGGRITLINSAHAALTLRKKCVVAAGTVRNGRRVVTAVVANITRLNRRAATGWAMLACGGKGANWLSTRLRPGDMLSVSSSISGGTPRAAVGGGAVLVSRGRAVTDRTARIKGNTKNPETFACVSSNGRTVLLGAVDGRTKASAGVTFTELTRYLRHLHCYSGIVFDGGGSTTMVARLPRHRTTSVVNVPSEHRQRKLPDALFVYAH